MLCKSTVENMTQPTIRESFTFYHPEKLSFSPVGTNGDYRDGFLLRIRLARLPSPGENITLLHIPDVLTLRAGTHTFPADYRKLSDYEKGECYHVYTDKNGVSPFIEASLFLRRSPTEEPREMRLGLPLLLYNAAENDVFLLFDGVRFAFLAEGEIVNCNYPVGYPAAEGTGETFLSDLLQAAICFDPSAMPKEKRSEMVCRCASFYSARGYNTWAGDIVNFYHDGVYHLIVLFDRHHHGNRFGGGAHVPFHMTTKDFIHWENHGEMTSLETQWETFGTGTMLFFNGKYYYVHGLHTDRVIPRESVGSRLLEKEYEKEQCFRAVGFDTLEKQALYPSGASYMESQDGISFTPSRKQIHCAENPSVYSSREGDLIMYAGYGVEGVFRAPEMDGPWVRADTDLPIYGGSSPVGNSTECPCIFTWNGYTYIIMGFTGFWQSGYQNRVFRDLAAVGEDIYDGLCVPMVANCDGRYILSGWVNGSGWAYVLGHRELIQHKNGRLGLRWLPELTPHPTEDALLCRIKEVKASDTAALEERCSYYLTCTVLPEKDGRIGIRADGTGNPFVFTVDSGRRRAQIREAESEGGFPSELKALCECIPHIPEGRRNTHATSRDFSIIGVEETSKPYTLRMILHYEPKTDSLVVDTEIGGGRTLISNRVDFRAKQLSFLSENAVITDFSLYRLP